MVMKNNVTKIFAGLRGGSKFLSIKKYVNNHNEVSNFSICFHINYRNAVERSIDMLRKMSMKSLKTADLDLHLFEQGKVELLQSMADYLAGNSRSTVAHVYEDVSYDGKKDIKGIKYHPDTDTLHLYGFLVSKKVILPVKMEDNREALTRAKDRIRDRLPCNRYRQFKLRPNNFEQILVEKMVLSEDDLFKKVGNGTIDF